MVYSFANTLAQFLHVFLIAICIFNYSCKYSQLKKQTFKHQKTMEDVECSLTILIIVMVIISYPNLKTHVRSL